MPIPGYIPLSGPLGPSDTTDGYPVTDSLFALGGAREVVDHATRNSIPYPRRRSGMMIHTQDDGHFWSLAPEPWTGTDADWYRQSLPDFPDTPAVLTTDGAYNVLWSDYGTVQGTKTFTFLLGIGRPVIEGINLTNGLVVTLPSTVIRVTIYAKTAPAVQDLFVNINANGVPLLGAGFTLPQGQNYSTTTVFDTASLDAAAVLTIDVVQADGQDVTVELETTGGGAGGGGGDVGGGGGGGGGVTPGDPVGGLQYNNAGAFGGMTNSVVDNVHSSLAVGIGCTATNNNSMALGGYNTASGDSAMAEGQTNVASGVASHAEGLSNFAVGDFSHCEGMQSKSMTDASHVEGSYNVAAGKSAHVEGDHCVAYGDYCHAQGARTFAGYPALTCQIQGSALIIHGQDLTGAFSSGTNIFVFDATGGSDTAYYTAVVFSSTYENEGSPLTTILTNVVTSHVAGHVTITNSVTNAHAEGYSTVATGHTAHAEGSGTVASGDSCHAEGNGTTASGSAAHAEGDSTNAVGDSSHAEGQSNYAYGYIAHAEGVNNSAYGKASHVEGSQSIALGDYSHVEGTQNVAAGDSSHAEGDNSYVYGNYSHAEGQGALAGYLPVNASLSDNLVTISGQDLTADFPMSCKVAVVNCSGGTGPGFYTAQVYGTAFTAGNTVLTLNVWTTHTSGYIANTSKTSYAHAEGRACTAKGDYSHAEGDSTYAQGHRSHAGGCASVADLNNKWAHGNGGFQGVPSGSSQAGLILASALTEDATPTVLLTDRLVGGSQLPLVRTDTAYGFNVLLVAKMDTTVAMFRRSGLVLNTGGTVSLVGSIQTVGTDINTPGWGLAVTAADGAITITVTGDASPVHWTARIDTLEVG